jgi:predicted phosphodiesterase
MKKFKCALISDTHAGFDKSTIQIHEKFFRKLASENIDVLFWAGDIGSSKQSDVESSFKLARKSLPGVKIVLIFGNHDWWNGRPDKLPWKQDIDLYSHIGFYRARNRLPVRLRPQPYGMMVENHKKWATENDIILLDGDSYNLSENIVVLGMMGWYKETNVQVLGTNDYKYMPEKIQDVPVHMYLSYKAEKDLEKLLYTDTEGKTVVFITHFPPFTEDPAYEKYCANPKFMDFMTEKADYLLVGHSHKACDFIHNDCRVMNCGSDYNKPKYIIFEIEG